MANYVEQLSNWSSPIYAILAEHWKFILLGLLFAASLFFLLMIAQINRSKSLNLQLRKSNDLLRHIQPSIGLEKNLDYLLEMISGIVNVPTYAFYTLDAKNHNYVLKTVRQNTTEMARFGPLYSSLPFKKEAFMPPISLNIETFPNKTDLIKEGEVPLLFMPIQGGQGLVRMGPVHKVKSNVRRTLDNLSDQAENVLHLLLEAEKMKNQIDGVVVSGKALQNISSIAIDSEVNLKVMLTTSLKALGGSGCFFITWDGAEFSLSQTIKMNRGLEKQLESDSAALAFWYSLVEEQEICILNQEHVQFDQRPEYFASLKDELYYVVKIFIGLKTAVVVFWFEQSPNLSVIEVQKTTLLEIIKRNMEGMYQSQQGIKELTSTYTDMLRMLSRMTDDLNPYTVGYSELMSRYSLVIAHEMKLGVQETSDVALAAFLSNIGVLGISSDFFEKEGKFTETEYELMKLHSEVGASIIQMTIGNKGVAANVMHHHERMDGNGYPAGLKGNEIPIGARIIAVVQTFLAKINGRRAREPMRFDQALQSLKSSMGSQLDPEVVTVLVNWFEQKQSDPTISERSLGSCWEMCCTPSIICNHCPAYQRTDKNCWSFETNNCASHGKICSSCFVYTEYQTRNNKKVNTGK